MDFQTETRFPRTMVGDVSLPRMIIGTNWLLGYSHTSHAADCFINERYAGADSFTAILAAYLRHGVDAIMGPFSTNEAATAKLLKAEEALGRRLIIIDTPVVNVDDTADARRETQAVFKRSAAMGATFCFLHHVSCEQLVNKNRQTMDRLPDYLSMIRDAGLKPGLSAHMPEVLQYADLNGYDVETYIQIFNCLGFLMQVEIEAVLRVIHAAKKPVMTIKPLAAGRVSPYVGLTFNWNVLRPQDLVTVGAFSPYEVEEDIEISRAALERRLPNLEGRGSPAKQSVLHGA